MVSNPVWEICERVAEVQALLDGQLAGGKHSAADVVTKAHAVLSKAELLQAMFDVGYFPPNKRWASHFEYRTRIRSKALLAAFIATPRVGYS